MARDLAHRAACMAAVGLLGCASFPSVPRGAILDHSDVTFKVGRDDYELVDAEVDTRRVSGHRLDASGTPAPDTSKFERSAITDLRVRETNSGPLGVASEVLLGVALGLITTPR